MIPMNFRGIRPLAFPCDGDELAEDPVVAFMKDEYLHVEYLFVECCGFKSRYAIHYSVCLLHLLTRLLYEPLVCRFVALLTTCEYIHH